MKRIGIYFFCVVALGCVTSSILYQKSELEDKIRLEKTAQDTVTEENEPKKEDMTDITLLEVSESNRREERFLVLEEEGYLVIYDRVSLKRYDETTIQVRGLPVDLQKKVTEGIYFSDEEALYAFLESYSS